MVASKLVLLMWSTDNVHRQRLNEQLSTMWQRPHENLVLVAKGHMQYRWFRSKLKEQEVVKKEKIQLKANIAVEDGKEFDALVGQVVESGGQKVAKAKEEYIHLVPKLKANMDWIKATKHVQRSIMQDSQLLLRFMAT